MAGHSKFKNIMFRKGAQDKKRAKIFAKLGREIQIASKQGGKDPNLNHRLRTAIEAAKAVGKFLANNWGYKHPRVDTPDDSVVEATNLSYPTPQCRFDTYMAGLKGELRPRCWYAED